MSNYSDFIHTIQLGQITKNTKSNADINHAILYELQDLKHLKLTGRTLAQQKEIDEEHYRIVDRMAFKEEVQRYNSLSLDEKFTEDLFSYKSVCWFVGLVLQIWAQLVIFLINYDIKTKIILSISSIVLHILLQIFSYLGFLNNWKPKYGH